MKLARLKDRLALALPERGMPIILSCFAPLGDNLAGWETIAARSKRVNGMDLPPPAAVYLPVGGMGSFGWPAIQGHRNGAAFILEPTGWTASNDNDALTLVGSDSIAAITLRLTFQMSGIGVLVMQTEFTNTGTTAYSLDRCMAASLLIPGGADTITSYRGKWGQEFQETTEAAGQALWLLESRRGRTSHDRFPAVAASCKSSGLYGLHLGWSGNHVMAVDMLDDGRSLVHAGELFEPGEITLSPGESYLSPKAYAAHVPGGDIGDLSAAFHAVVRGQILTWPKGKMKPRPVIMNTWEGTYFSHDMERLKRQATIAAEIGIERFVLDDGWFGKRDDDTSSLGDWFIDKRKYPHGLKPLVDHVLSLGMEFGIWFEPEMVSQNSDLFRKHPDWALQVLGRPLLTSRNQLVLDLTRSEVSEYLFACINDVLRNCAISYIKWDMNRDLTHVGGADGRAKTSQQTRAVYALMDRIRTAHPDLEIESCASGGGRADYGVLEHAHRVWISDCTDALERLTIQRGARRFLPPEIMGCHISASPNHQTERRHTLAFRAIVAFFGHFGIELDPSALSQGERDELAGWISLHKSLRSVLHSPLARSFDQPIVDGRHVFGLRLDDDSGHEHLIVAVAQATHPRHEQPAPLRLPIGRGAGMFSVRLIGPVATPFARSIRSQLDFLSGKQIGSGDWLAGHGIPVPQLYPESAILLEIRTVKE
ncbi:MAG: alpha-galactosidase [Aestuariivirga sp.]